MKKKRLIILLLTLALLPLSSTYSRYITGTASPSSVGDDAMRVIPLDGTHYQITVGDGYENASVDTRMLPSGSMTLQAFR